jgi:hypothetical protein
MPLPCRSAVTPAKAEQITAAVFRLTVLTALTPEKCTRHRRRTSTALASITLNVLAAASIANTVTAPISRRARRAVSSTNLCKLKKLTVQVSLEMIRAANLNLLSLSGQNAIPLGKRTPRLPTMLAGRPTVETLIDACSKRWLGCLLEALACRAPHRSTSDTPEVTIPGGASCDLAAPPGASVGSTF